VNAIDESIARLGATNPATTVKYINLVSPPAEALATQDAATQDATEDDLPAVSAAVAIASNAKAPGELSVNPDRRSIAAPPSNRHAPSRAPQAQPTPIGLRQPDDCAIEDVDEDLLDLLLADLAM
jgi:hypothetical protein